MSVKIFLINCPKCFKRQQTWSTKRSPLNNVRTCCYCGKRFQIKRENIIGRVK